MIKSEQIERLIELSHQYLSHQKEPVSERQLVIELTRHGMWDSLGKSSAIIRQFQTHFLTMHALYRLQDKLSGSRMQLEISPDAIYMRDLDDPEDAAALPEQEEPREKDEAAEVLRGYYLDLSKLRIYNGTVASSEDDYKRRHRSWHDHKDSYATLDLNAGANWSAVQSAYRQKAVQHHPDKGGCAQDFQRVRDAYQDLKRTLRP